jgi:hypothetical protein
MHLLLFRDRLLLFDGYQVFVAFRTGRLVYIYSEKMGSIRNFSLFLLFVFNTIFNNFTAIYLGSVVENPSFSDKLYSALHVWDYMLKVNWIIIFSY